MVQLLTLSLVSRWKSKDTLINRHFFIDYQEGEHFFQIFLNFDFKLPLYTSRSFLTASFICPIPLYGRTIPTRDNPIDQHERTLKYLQMQITQIDDLHFLRCHGKRLCSSQSIV